VDQLWLKILPHLPYSLDLASSDYHLFGPIKNAGLAEICITYEIEISCSSVAWTAASIVFAEGILKLAKVFNTWQVVKEWAKYCTN